MKFAIESVKSVKGKKVFRKSSSSDSFDIVDL